MLHIFALKKALDARRKVLDELKALHSREDDGLLKRLIAEQIKVLIDQESPMIDIKDYSDILSVIPKSPTSMAILHYVKLRLRRFPYFV